MKDMILPPHGGCGLINKIIPEEEMASVMQESSGYKSYTISNADLSTFYRIADGTLSPLEGPMGSNEFYRVLDEETIERNGEKYAWTIPIVFPVHKGECEALEIGETIAVKNECGVIVGLLETAEIYRFDKTQYNRVVYGTDRSDHPGPRIVNEDPRDYLLGGKIMAFTEQRHPLYDKYMLSPKETRQLFKRRKWERIVAFQTRNPLHRAHEYAIVYAVEKLTREGYLTGAVINPLVGETKSDDVPAQVRMRTYEVLIGKKLLGRGDEDELFWKAKGYDINDHLLLIALDMRMFYAGPKEAIMHAIYRQNYGFSDIIIGRKHADAHFDDGTAAWGDFDAQNKFDNLKGELLINPLKVGSVVYFERLGRMGLLEESKGKGPAEINISGRELRKKLEKGEPVDRKIMRREITQILSDAYKNNIGALRTSIKSNNINWHYCGIAKEDREIRNGHRGTCIWLTGLSYSGKSTIAVELQKELFKMGCQVFVLDGDNIRHGLNRDLGFSPEDRQENIRRIGEVAKLFTEAGFLVITAFISPYRNDRDNVRTIFKKGDFIEVYVKSDISVCEKRDDKGLYKKARCGIIKDFTGISAPYEEPLNPELVVDTNSQAKEESVQYVLVYLLENGYIKKGGKRC